MQLTVSGRTFLRVHSPYPGCSRGSCAISLSETPPLKPAKDFKLNVDKLAEKFISDKLKQSLLKIWDKRNDYHHLNPNVKTDRQALEELAREKAHLLAEVESEVFHFTFADGKIIPEHPEYWKGANQVFLRFEP